MPPKRRPRRATVGKSSPAPVNVSLSTDSANDVVSPETDSVKFLNEASTAEPVAIPVPQSDTVIGSSLPVSEGINVINDGNKGDNDLPQGGVGSSPENPPQSEKRESIAVIHDEDDNNNDNSGNLQNDGVSSETVGRLDPVMNDGGESRKDNVENFNGVKAKKIVKKTVKVVKKVIKKVPKKVVKAETDSKIDISNSNPSLKPVSVSVNLDAANQNNDEVSVCMTAMQDGEQKIEGGHDDKVKGKGLMEVDNNNVANVATNVENEEERRGDEEKVGEGKLFRGELEAMERRKRRKTEVFVGGIDRDATEDDVRKVFSEAGEIVDMTLVLNAKTGKNKIAFLRFASAEEAKRALDMFSEVEICGKKCRAAPVEGNDTIFLGNIDKKWKDNDVLKLLHDIGIEKIDKVIVMIDPNANERNRGFAFVELETSKDAQIAYRKLQKKDVFGKNQEIKVAWAEPLKELNEEEMLKVKTVYAEFIPSSWDEEKVRDVFKNFGEIDNIVLARNLRTTKRKDFAFISYKSREAALECIELFGRESKDENGTKVNVRVSLAKPMTKSKKAKPAAIPVAKEVPKAKTKASHSYVRSTDLRNRVQPGVAHYDTQLPERSSTNTELVRLLREQASWRPPHGSLSNSPMDIHYSNHSGRKRQFSELEADPRYPGTPLYPRSRLDVSFPVASSSHSLVPPSGLTSSLAYPQSHSGYPFGSLYGARNYASNIERRDKAHGNSILYRRYLE